MWRGCSGLTTTSIGLFNFKDHPLCCSRYRDTNLIQNSSLVDVLAPRRPVIVFRSNSSFIHDRCGTMGVLLFDKMSVVKTVVFIAQSAALRVGLEPPFAALLVIKWNYFSTGHTNARTPLENNIISVRHAKVCYVGRVIHTYTHTHTCIRTYVHTYIRTYIHTHVCVCVCVCVCMCVCVCFR